MDAPLTTEAITGAEDCAQTSIPASANTAVQRRRTFIETSIPKPNQSH
jgi:hypothetical protein